MARVASARLLLALISGWPFLRILFCGPETSGATRLKMSSYRWDTRGSEKGSDLPKVTLWQGRDQNCLRPQAAGTLCEPSRPLPG